MKTGIPSISDFLKLCRADNQQLAAEQLNNMLKTTNNTDIFIWEINVIPENDCGLLHNDDELDIPLALAAKYGNTPICKVLIEKIDHKLSLTTKILLCCHNRKRNSDYSRRMQKQDANNSYAAFKLAIKYNKFATAEYLYTFYETKACSENYVTEKLINMIKNTKNISQLDFLLQKINFSNSYALSLPYRLLDLATSSAEKNNWEIASYIITKHTNFIKKASSIKIKIFLNEALKNKQFDIALMLIKNTPKDIFYKQEKFKTYNVLEDSIFLNIGAKDFDAETNEWLNNAINSN
jgi:hypothetical protein